MLTSLLSVFGPAGKRSRQRKQLQRPEYDVLFDEPPVDEWVSLDLEMTGLNPKTDAILSVGAVIIRRKQGAWLIDSGQALSILCRPPVMPSHDSIVIHGLRPSDVAQGVDYEAMLGTLLPFMGSRPLVGFCIDRDMAFLNAIAKPFLGVNLPNALVDVSQLEQQLRQRQNRHPAVINAPKHLNQLLDEFAIPRLSAHDALNDAMMTAMLFTHLQPKLRQ